MYLLLMLLSCTLLAGTGHGWALRAALAPRQHRYYSLTGSIGLPTYPISSAPSGGASGSFPPKTLTGPSTKPTSINTPPYSNFTQTNYRLLYPRGSIKPTFLPSGTGAPVVPTGHTSSYTSVSPSNHTKAGPTALPPTSIPLPTASPSNATASSPSTAPTSTPSTFQLKTTGTSTSYLSVQPDLNGQDALLLSRYPSSATAFTLNPDGTLQSGGTFAGVYADVTDTILLMQTGALMGGSFNKSVCSVAGGELKCRTEANEKFFACGKEGERFVEIGDEAGGMGDGCFGFELVVVPV